MNVQSTCSSIDSYCSNSPGIKSSLLIWITYTGTLFYKSSNRQYLLTGSNTWSQFNQNSINAHDSAHNRRSLRSTNQETLPITGSTFLSIIWRTIPRHEPMGKKGRNEHMDQQAINWKAMGISPRVAITAVTLFIHPKKSGFHFSASTLHSPGFSGHGTIAHQGWWRSGSRCLWQDDLITNLHCLQLRSWEIFTNII